MKALHSLIKVLELARSGFRARSKDRLSAKSPSDAASNGRVDLRLQYIIVKLNSSTAVGQKRVLCAFRK